MITTIEKKFHVDQTIEQVWAYLSDPSKVVTCVPGAEITEKVDDTNYKGTVAMKFGPVSAKYNGKIELTKMDVENYEMTINGRGTDARGKGGADMVMNGKLTQDENGGTNVDYSMEVSVTGMLAQFGSRLIGDVSNQIAGQFVQNFKAKLEGGETSEEDVTGESDSGKLNAAKLMGNVVKDKLSGLFGGKKETEETE